MGFKHVESSPLTRSSYHAREQAGVTILGIVKGFRRTGKGNSVQGDKGE
jgi:hypothetical protein